MDVRTLCLGILSLSDATGYEIKKLVAEGSFSFFSEASYGSIYPALTKLTKEGLITCEAMAQDKRPDKKVYSLTKEGQEELTHRLRKGPGPDKNRSEFLAAILFAEAVSPDRVSDLVEDRIREHKLKLRAMEDLLDGEMTTGSTFVVEYGIAMQRAALNYLTANKTKLNKPLDKSA